MSFTRSTTDTTVHQQMPDYPSAEGYTANQLKTAFDAPATGLKGDINGLIDELEDTSSASNLGASAIADGDASDGNVQAKLEKIYEDLQGIALGDIPDGTITKAKLDDDYSATIAEKDGTLQTGLNTEKLNGKTEAQLKTSFLGTANPYTLSFSANSGDSTVTETKTQATNGTRYFMMVFSYGNIKFALYDAQTQKFVFAHGQVTAINTNNIQLENSQVTGKVSLNATYSSKTLTLAVTKQSNSISGSITIFELCGEV